jgi:hypothetical protein
LLRAAELPTISAFEKEITELPVEERQLALAFVQMLKHNTDEIPDKIMRVILEPWKGKGIPTQQLRQQTRKPGKAR